MIGEVGYFIDSLRLVVCLACDYYLGRFLTDLFEYLIYSLFKEVGGVGALLLLGLSALYELHQGFE